MKLKHVAILVESIETARKFYDDLFQVSPKVESIESEKVLSATYSLENCEVELIEPYVNNEHLQKRLREHGEGLHHIAFDSNNLDHPFKISGFPSPGKDNSMVSFLSPKRTHGALIELIKSMT